MKYIVLFFFVGLLGCDASFHAPSMKTWTKCAAVFKDLPLEEINKRCGTPLHQR